MATEKFKRKEVLLSATTIKLLGELAKSDKRNLKNYMEIVLSDHAKVAHQHMVIDAPFKNGGKVK